jgi:hypothetical protein
MSEAPKGEGLMQNATDKAEKPKASIRDYAFIAAVVAAVVSVIGAFVSIATLVFSRQELQLTQQGQFSERYEHAIEQLDSESPTIRLSGV